MSLLSAKSGWLFKRNESNVWVKRWCAVVPHTFLYYFDNNKSSSQPVGIIDLECYSNVQRSEGHIMELCGEKVRRKLRRLRLRPFVFLSSVA